MRGLALVVLLGSPAMAQDITAAHLTLPTDRYDHAVLGDALEWGGLDMTLAGGGQLRVTLPADRVFEDVEARLADLDGNGSFEVVVVETSLTAGASLAVYDARGKRAATAHIGQRNRWLAPAGIADFDSDGRTEIAYVDRPHLARELVFVRLQGDTLTEIARATGFTNHRIGDRRIAGGVNRCPDQTSLLLASADWSRLLRVNLDSTGITTTDLGPWPASGPNLETCS